MSRLLKTLLLLSLVLPLPALGQSEDWKAFNLELTDSVIIPAYMNLAAAGSQMAEQANGFCAQVDEEGLAGMQQAFHDAMDAWQSIQHVKFGPITYFNWQYRLQYWPDDNGTGARQLDAMLAEKNRELLDSETFARQSVGVQGFPALERLLFGESSLEDLQQDQFRCRVVVTIANNIGEIGAGIVQRWQDEFRATVALDDDSGFFEDLQDASTDFMKALVETVPVIQEQKLTTPLGESEQGFRERRAESWRSRRSLRNVRLNMAALSLYYHGIDDQFSAIHMFAEEDAEVVTAAFGEVDSLLETMPDSLTVQIQNEGGYEDLVSLEAALDNLYEALETAVKNTELYLGFNSLDGD